VAPTFDAAIFADTGGEPEPRKLQPPRSDRPVVDLTYERVERRPVPGGLITEYERAA
jgi:hypothetical protein